MDFSKAIFKNEDGEANWDAIAKAIEGCDETALSYFKTLDDGNGTINNQSASVKGLGAHLQATGQSFNFAVIKATLLNAALNAGIMLLASFAIDGIIKAWDKMNLTVEEQTAKVNELKSSYESLKSEYNTLSQKQNITDAEKRRLEYLERRLELDERILKAEEHQLFEEKTGNKFTDWFDEDNYNTQYEKETSINRMNVDPNNYAFLSKLYDKKMQDIKVTQEQIDTWTEYKNAVDEGSNEWKAYQSSIDALQNRQTDAMKDLADGADKMTVNLGKYADNIEYFEERLASGDLSEEETAIAQVQLSNWKELYNSTEKMIADIQKLNGTYDYTNDRMLQSIRSLSDEHGISNRDEYVQLEEYTKDFTDEQKNLWLEATQGAENATQAIEAYESALSDTQQQSKTPVSFNITTYEESIDNIQSTISTLRSALDSFNKGELDESSVLDLMQQFPELAPYIDLAADGFGNLSEGLSTLIAQQPETLIQDLQALKSSLNTEEERAQVDLLINSLQALSSYGDTGMEAYATTIGSTWSDTVNVIESVTTQFENLVKVQEAVADGLTMSTTAAAELAKMYPEILTNAEYAGNGQITLNEEVVNSILDGDKSIIDAQIAKLEADKAELAAKKSFAETQLNMVKQVAEGEGNITKEVAQYRVDIANQLLKILIEAGMEEDKAYAAVAENMAGNMNEYNRIVGEVAQDTSKNMDAAAVSMANSISINSINAQTSFENMQKKVWDLADAIKAAGNGERAGNSGTYGGGGSTSMGTIKADTYDGRFTRANNTYDAKELNLKDFQSQLEIDIKGYTDAISNIDAQIDVLKNLQSSFDNNGGIGGHGYSDKIKDLEKEKDKINSALDDAKKGSTKETKDKYQELVDFFERRNKVLNDALSLLKTNLDNVTGAFAKNNLIDAQLGVTEEKFKNYSDALNMYTQKANEALSKLPSDIASKIKDGAVDLTTFVGDGNQDVVEAIKDYEQWADKVADCKQELAELRTAIRQLELDKFNNIMEEFQNQFDLHEDGKGLISKQIDLLKEAGQLIGESFFTSQIDQSKKQLELLEAEKAQLVGQMNSAIGSGRVD